MTNHTQCNADKTEKNLSRFLVESNAIEREYTDKAYEEAYKAWKFLIFFNEITLSRLLETHKILMYKLDKRIAGQIRNIDVWVSSHILMKPILLHKSLEKLLKSVPVTEAEMEQWHIMFERIHPFVDGNGRIGRILYNFQRIKNNLPIYVFEEKNKNEYYEWFNEKRTRKN